MVLPVMPGFCSTLIRHLPRQLRPRNADHLKPMPASRWIMGTMLSASWISPEKTSGAKHPVVFYAGMDPDFINLPAAIEAAFKAVGYRVTGSAFGDSSGRLSRATVTDPRSPGVGQAGGAAVQTGFSGKTA
jgi:hypothetical protein